MFMKVPLEWKFSGTTLPRDCDGYISEKFDSPGT